MCPGLWFWKAAHPDWTPDQGDALVTREGGRLERPPTWLDEGDDPEQARQALLPLLELPVDLVLTTHGDPMRQNGAESLRTALLESST